MFCCSREFSAGKTQKVVFHLLSNRIFLKILVNQQTTYITRGGFPNVWKRLDGFWGLSKRLQGLHRPRLSQQTQDKNRHAEYARHEIQLSQKISMPGMPAIKTKLVPRLSQRRIIGAQATLGAGRCLCTPNYDIEGIPIFAACRLTP